MKFNSLATKENQFMVIAPVREEIGPAAMAIFWEKIRPQLTESDKGKYLVINVDTGGWVIDPDMDEVERLADAKLSDPPRQFLMRAGYRSIISFRPGSNLELPEW